MSLWNLICYGVFLQEHTIGQPLLGGNKNNEKTSHLKRWKQNV